MEFREYIEEFGGLPNYITGAGPISNHGKYIDEMIAKLKEIKVTSSPHDNRVLARSLKKEKKKVKLAQKAISDLERLRKSLNTIHYGKGM